MEIKLSLWLWPLILAVLDHSSEAGKSELIRPSNLRCACPNDQLSFNCTVVIENRIGATEWSGTAFTGCDGNRIQLRHSNADATGRCNNGAISANLEIIGDCATSELNVTADSSLNNKTVQCILNSVSGIQTIDTATIMMMTGPYQEAPDGVILTDARPDQLTFSWSQIDPSCSAVQYQNTSDCGRCSLATPTSTLANCYDLKLSTTARNCTFSVGSEICGFTGPSSDPIIVTLKVPDAPQVNLIPVYSNESQALTNLIIEIRSQMDPFSIYESISGSIVSFIIQNSLGTIETIPAADCIDSVCRSEVRPPFVCQPSSGDSTVNVSAANRLGPGPASQSTPVGCTNSVVTADIDSTASTLTCRFQNNQNTIQKTCRVVYGVCGQQQVFTTEGNSTARSPDRVTLQLSLPSGTNCYTYTITAYDGTSTAMVEGRVNLSDEGSTRSNVAAIVIPIVLILILIVVIVAITIALVIWKFRFRDRKEKYHVYEAPPDSTKNISNIYTTNPACAKREHADGGEIESVNLHRGESNLSIDKEEQECINKVPEDNVSNIVGDDVQPVVEDENGYESAIEDLPDNNLTQSGDDHSNVAESDNENSNIGGGGVIGVALHGCTDDY